MDGPPLSGSAASCPRACSCCRSCLACTGPQKQPSPKDDGSWWINNPPFLPLGIILGHVPYGFQKSPATRPPAAHTGTCSSCTRTDLPASLAPFSLCLTSISWNHLPGKLLATNPCLRVCFYRSPTQESSWPRAHSTCGPHAQGPQHRYEVEAEPVLSLYLGPSTTSVSNAAHYEHQTWCP